MYYVKFMAGFFLFGCVVNMMDNTDILMWSGYEWVAVFFALCANMVSWQQAPIRSAVWSVLCILFVMFAFFVNNELRPNAIMVLWSCSLMLTTTTWFWSRITLGAIAYVAVKKYNAKH